MTAVTNSAVESSSTWRMSQVGGLDGDVRQDAEADHDPGHHPERDQGPGRIELMEQAVTGRRQNESDRPTQQGTQDTDVSDQRLPRGACTPLALRAVMTRGSA